MTVEQVKRIIEEIHGAPPQAVVAVAGAGSQAVAWLLGVAGASRTLLEVLVPYGRLSMIDFLGHEPTQFVSAEAASAMAGAAYRRAVKLREDGQPAIGLACTATIATDRPKRGEHRAYVAAWDQSGCKVYSLHLHKGLRDREGEEELVSRLLINALAEASGVGQARGPEGLSSEALSSLGMTEKDGLETTTIEHPEPIDLLLEGGANSVMVHPGGGMFPDEPWHGAVLPGSFRPFHQGHDQLAKAAADILGCPVIFELSVLNVDKPPLESGDIRERLTQFAGKHPVVLTRAETFRKKAGIFPGCTFVIGWDTAVRLVAPRYYGDSTPNMLAALAGIWAADCRFLVAGRQDQGRFKALKDVPIPEGFQPMFQEIPESVFREDVSSTALRTGS